MLNYSVKVGQQEEEFSSQEQVFTPSSNPFPGLRPFSMDECHLFFGRESHVEEILLKLSHKHSIAVLGYSGSGKSSLMYSGVIPMLYGGFMTETGPHWKVVVARPGASPIQALADSIVTLLLNDGRIDEADATIHRAIILSVLRSGSNGLIEICRYLQTHHRENVFVLIDQFEELFRYRNTESFDDDNEALAFVNLILNLAHQRQIPAYLAISMRSDFIGDCSSFPGLTELINDSTYLVPQLSREQKKKTIEGPISVAGGKISHRLVKRLLSDIGDDQDQLPLLQHALMRTWNYWVDNREAGEPMDIRHYTAIGQLSQALSLHANEAYEELNPSEKEIAEVLFKSITEKNQENLGVRRQAKVSHIAELASTSESLVINVIDKFREPGRSFLMPAHNVSLGPESAVELSHESLMRIWTRLAGWVDEEFESARMYKRVSDAAAMYQIGKTSLWRPPDLQLALNWQKKQNPTRVWAERYDVAFERAIVFLDTSRITFEAELKNQEMLQRRMLRRARITNIILAIALVISIGIFFYGLTQNIRAQQERETALRQTDIAKAQTIKALAAEKLATTRADELAKKEKELIDRNERLQQALEEARIARKEASQEAQNAIRQERLANDARSLAEQKNEELLRETKRANENFDKANSLFYLTVAQSLVSKSENIDDKTLAGLTAMQGYKFHTRYNGRKYDPYIFRGLYYALAKLNGFNYNSVKLPSAKNRLFGLAVSRKSGTFYTTGNDGRVQIGNYASMQPGEVLADNGGITNRVIALSPDEKFLVTGNDSSQLVIINLEKRDAKPVLLKGNGSSITDIKFKPDGSEFVSVSANGMLRITDPTSGKSRKAVNLSADIRSIDFSRDGRWIAAAAASGKVLLIDVKDYSFKVISTENSARVTAVAFSTSVASLLAYGVEVLVDGKTTKGTLKLLDVESGKGRELSGHKAAIADIEFSPDGKLLASAGLDKKLLMWVVDNEKDLPIEMDNNNGYVWHLGFANGSDFLIASCNNGEVRVWPTDAKALAEQVCPKLDRNMTKEEWRIYVADESEITYESTCVSLLIKDF